MSLHLLVLLALPVSHANVPVLGNGSHSPDQVKIVQLSKSSDDLAGPVDLDFNPAGEGELWVVNRSGNSTTTYYNVGTSEQTARTRRDGAALHFMDKTNAVAFGAPMTFATCGDSRNTQHGWHAPDDFMGPALWSADPAIYAKANPIGLGSHLDMLHQSPLCMGLAWEQDNVYWSFDGHSGSITRNDFVKDHGPGYDDHADGRMARYGTGEFLRMEGVPSHLEYEPSSKLLYIVDSGHQRVAVLDTTSGTRGALLPVKEHGTELAQMDGAVIRTLISPEAGEFVKPSGIALNGDLIYVTDSHRSRITAFTKEGARVDWLDLGWKPGSLIGLTFDTEGHLYVVDAAASRLYRIETK